MTASALRHITPGTVVTFPPSHPTRAGQRGTVDQPVDRGDLTNQAGFAAGVWVTFTDGSRAAMWADTQVSYTTLAWNNEKIVADAYATKQGASRAIRTASKTFYANVQLEIRVRPNPRINYVKNEYLVVALPLPSKEN